MTRYEMAQIVAKALAKALSALMIDWSANSLTNWTTWVFRVAKLEER